MNRAVLSFETGDFASAADGARTARDVYIKNGGPKTRHLISPYRVLGAASSQLGRHEDAITAVSATSDILRDTLGAEHPETQRVLAERALVLVEAREFERSIEVTGPLLEREPTLDDLPPETLIQLLSSHGRAHLELGKTTVAKTHLERAIELARDQECCKDWVHIYAIELGRLRHMLGDEAKAISDVKAALATLERLENPILADEVTRARAWLETASP